MALHSQSISPARKVALRVLHAVFSEGKTLLEAMPRIDDAPLSAQDRGLARQIVSGTARRLGTLHFVLKQYATRWDKLPAMVQRILELSAYQLLYLDRVPDYAVISEAVDLAKANRAPRLANVVNGILRSLARERDKIVWPDENDDFAEALAVNKSHPRWLVEQWLELWGKEETKALCKFNNSEAPLSLRLRHDPEQALAELAKWNVAITRDDRFTIRVDVTWESAPPPEFFNQPGWVAQDGAALLVVKALNPQPGWRVWDVCAAPGGKSFAIADAMNDDGVVLASDKSSERLKALEAAKTELGLQSIKTHTLDVLQAKTALDFGLFDAILVDAPCTGLGTFRRHPDLRWRLTPNDAPRLADMALRMLSAVEPYLKPGGVLLYSTCTLSPEENEGVMNAFLDQHPQMKLEPVTPYLPNAFQNAVTDAGTLRVFPPIWNLDGAFAARMLKEDR